MGRLVVILKNKDSCDRNNSFDSSSEVLGLGSLVIFKPLNIEMKDTHNYNNYLMREINTFNKFEEQEQVKRVKKEEKIEKK